MGEVYKARDTRLNRTVALKVIGTGFGERSELRERFAAEGRAIAALSHPNICTLYDTGHHDGRDFLVLEYLEGETLAERLRRGAVPGRELLGWAIEIADALDYAHRLGVVHRDLKPENVLLTRQGRAKVLDFGLAKLRSEGAQQAGIQGLPTAPVSHTAEGAVVGTLNYMAPERLDGRQTDSRSDVFAFGAVVYEVATGRKAFDAPTPARLIASILASDPLPVETKTSVPSDLPWLVHNCLVKDPDARWQSMGDVAKVLKAMARAGGTSVPPRRRRPWIPLALVGSALLICLIVLLPRLRRAGEVSDEGRAVSLELVPPAGGAFALTTSSISTPQFAVAPDGHAVVFVAMAEGQRQLWVRDLGNNEAHPVPDTKGASYPFWSPDSRWVGFFANGLLKKAGFDGRAPRDICPAPNARGGAWRQDDTVVFALATPSALLRVQAGGGAPVALTRLEAAHEDHRWPHFLPDGRLLFFVRSADVRVQGLYVVSLEKPSELHLLRPTSSSGLFASGWLLFLDEPDLMAQRLDVRTLQLSGETIPIGLKVTASSALQSAMSASSHGGVLATWSSPSALSELQWYDRRGAPLGSAGLPGQYVDFRLSPDDQSLAVSRIDANAHQADLAIVNLKTGDETALGPSPRTEASPVWSPDGTQLVFLSNRQGVHDLFQVPAQGGSERRIHTGPAYPTSWVGDTILFHTATQHDVRAIDFRGTEQAIVNTPAIEVQAQLAPGGRLAYTSDASGTLNVYVRPLDGKTAATNVSVSGGFDPRWRGDGRELFFMGTDGWLHAVEVQGDRPLRPATPRKLFRVGVQDPRPPYASIFDVTKNGAQFLINVPLRTPGAGPITLTLDWTKRIH